MLRAKIFKQYLEKNLQKVSNHDLNSDEIILFSLHPIFLLFYSFFNPCKAEVGALWPVGYICHAGSLHPPAQHYETKREEFMELSGQISKDEVCKYSPPFSTKKESS